MPKTKPKVCRGSVQEHKLPQNKKLFFCDTSYVSQVSQKWIPISVTLGLHRNYIYKEVSQNKKNIFVL